MSVCPECGLAIPSNSPRGICPSCLLGLGVPAQDSDSTAAYLGEPSDQLAIGDIFANLEIVQLVGRGGMGVVYQARHPGLDRNVALKVLPSEIAAEESFRDRFIQEARTLARLNHPNIVTIHDFGNEKDLYYFVMEFVSGSNLRDLLGRGVLSVAQCHRILKELCSALAYAHASGVAHRDLKPENVLLDDNGNVKLGDFGLAKLLVPALPGHALTQSRQVMGTPHYMAPEQILRPQQVDHRADLFSLGVLFYEMLTGELPLGKYEPPSKLVGTDEQVDRVIGKLMERDLAKRYQSIDELAADLDRIQASRGAHGETEASESIAIYTGNLHGGMSHAKGLARIEGDEFVVEYEVFPLGMFKSETCERRIALKELREMIVKESWFGTALILRATRLETLSRLPGNSQGEVVFTIRKGDRPAARRMAKRVMGMIRGEPVDTTPPQPEPTVAPLTVDSVLPTSAKVQPFRTTIMVRIRKPFQKVALLTVCLVVLFWFAVPPLRGLALEAAVAVNNDSLVSFALRLGAMPDEVADSARLMIWPIRAGNQAMVKTLIEHGARLSRRDSYGDTPLMWACYFGDRDIVGILLENKADPNLRNSHGRTALMWAAGFGHVQVVEQLIKSEAHLNLRDKDERPGSREVPSSRGWKWNARNSHITLKSGGHTALAMAVIQGYPEVVRALVEAGADPSIQNDDGQDAFALAASNGEPEVIVALGSSEKTN